MLRVEFPAATAYQENLAAHSALTQLLVNTAILTCTVGLGTQRTSRQLIHILIVSTGIAREKTNMLLPVELSCCCDKGFTIRD